jgi:membrane carboxypeptidase/penicillin-binding protein
VFGATLAGPIWKKIMIAASEGMELKQFDPPAPQYLVSPKKTVQDVRGKSPEEAKAILEQDGFKVEISDEPVQSEYPPGSVAETSPAGGTAASVGSSITISISSGGGDPANPGNGDGGGDGGDGGGEGDGGGIVPPDGGEGPG